MVKKIKINKYILGLLALALLTIGIAVGTLLVRENQDIREKAAPATTAYISPLTQDVEVEKEFYFSVKMDSGENIISGADIRVTFDPQSFEVISIEKGEGITKFDNVLSSTFDNTAGSIRYITFTVNKTKAVTGTGIEIFKVKAKAKTARIDKYNITLDPQTIASGLDEAQNIITSLTSGSINLVAAPLPTAGEPNSCGGTCGSNYNCKSGLFCYQGYCRNPSCSNDTDCVCSVVTATATATATSVATRTATATATATATVAPTIAATHRNSAFNATVRPTPQYTSISDPKGGLDIDDLALTTPLPDTDYLKLEEPSVINQAISVLLPYIFGSIAIIIAVVAAILLFKKNKDSNKPHILPPTNI